MALEKLDEFMVKTLVNGELVINLMRVLRETGALSAADGLGIIRFSRNRLEEQMGESVPPLLRAELDAEISQWEQAL